MDITKIHKAVGLLNCMVASGEQHSPTSLQIMNEAMEELNSFPLEAGVDVKIAKVIKQMKEWEQGAIRMDSFAGCSDAMAFTYKLCYELLESNFTD